MARWQDGYKVGQPVEHRSIMSKGERWDRGVVVRKTQTGMPVVQLDTGGTYAVGRKGDIRPRTRPPGGAPGPTLAELEAEQKRRGLTDDDVVRLAGNGASVARWLAERPRNGPNPVRELLVGFVEGEAYTGANQLHVSAWEGDRAHDIRTRSCIAVGKGPTFDLARADLECQLARLGQ